MDLLEKMNLALIETEQALYQSRSPVLHHPFFFVIGAPRSGTTVLTQALVHAMDAGYISNLAARFYLAPVIGIRLSKEVSGMGVPGFWSHLGNTTLPWDIHQFGKFWMNYLNFPNSAEVDIKQLSWGAAGMLKKTLHAIQNEFKRPIVMKGIYPAYCYKTINDILKDKVVWVNIERDPIDACISILKARRKKKGGWFGWYIPISERAHFMHGDIYWQIAYQVHYFRHFYHKIATYTVQLKDLCENPTQCLKDVCGEWMTTDDFSCSQLRFHTYGLQDDEDKRYFNRIWESINA